MNRFMCWLFGCKHNFKIKAKSISKHVSIYEGEFLDLKCDRCGTAK